MISTNKHLNLQIDVKAKMIFILRTVRPNSKVSHGVTAERNVHKIIETYLLITLFADFLNLISNPP